uniref:ZM domain-containing protein n=1 Tax=Panagrellus redivivus TaxID=6233 RepID=A0A7E4ZV20_PANRE
MATTLATLPPTVRQVDPGYRFKKIGSEEVHTVESFERKVHGTPYSDPKREFSTNQYTERRTYGRDQNGEIVVAIEKDPKEPVTPVRPVTPVGGHNYEDTSSAPHLLKPLPYVDTAPLHIPRPKSSPSRSSANSFVDQQNSPLSYGHSPRSGRSSGFGSAGTPARALSPAGSHVSTINGVPVKRVIRKSRLVSIHDGRPVSPYVETVTYEPIVALPAPTTTILRENDDYGDEYDTGSRRHGGRRADFRDRRGSPTSRSLHYQEDLEQLPLTARRSAERSFSYDQQQPINGSYYNTQRSRGSYNRAAFDDSSSYYDDNSRYETNSTRRGRLNRVREEYIPAQSSNYDHQPRRRSYSESGRRHHHQNQTREKGAMIIENPLFRNY